MVRVAWEFVSRWKEKTMRLSALGAISALTLGACLGAGSVTAQAADFGYGGYDEPETVVTRRTVVEQRVVQPQRIVREEIIERPPVYVPRRVVREVIEERPVVYRPRPVIRDVVVDRERFYDHRPYGPRPVGFRHHGPDFDPYD
jgi:hypothetical protein